MSDHSQYESMSESESRASHNESSKGKGNPVTVVNDVDEETLRIMVSTDNHLGYAEKDPIRGDDSFAAFEEVLLLAKRHKCDMVLLAGDLFHHNKPSRLTLHKTMTILRRHTRGPNPVQFQILSDQAKNFRSTITKTVNYEDPYSCIDLPIFTIHGNHDDPTRDGGTEMLAALDLLAVNRLVNYFGRQDEVDKVQVSPVLIQKGEGTKVALYGMGSMRDERLNRMWQGKKVRFLRPHPEDNGNDNSEEEEDSDEEENMNGGWFNIFALHQNRDLGRGTKNCVHESMIPEWMDLVVWGHEHECLIHPSESAVGTFRITQPGSSVATSLTEGESMRKHVGILDVRGSQFRMTAVPLMQVRGFATGSITLSDCENLDADDPRIDEAMREVLAEEVKKLAETAREGSRLLRRDARKAAGGSDRDGDDVLLKHLHFQVKKPDQVLVRLKVEHSGFTTLHNQRFGSQFVNNLANPSEILLFHRRRTTVASKSGKKKGNSKAEDSLSAAPIQPESLDDINLEDFVKGVLTSSGKKLQILDEQRLSIAVEDYVSKDQKGVLGETVLKILSEQRKNLVKRGIAVDDDEEGPMKVSTANAVREACQADTQQRGSNGKKGQDNSDESEHDEEFSAPSSNASASWQHNASVTSSNASTRRQQKSSAPSSNASSRRQQTLSFAKTPTKRRNRDEDSDEASELKEPKRARAAPKKKAPARKAPVRSNRRSRQVVDDVESDDYNDADGDGDNDVDDFEEEVEEVRKSRAQPKKRAARKTTAKKKRYAVDDSDDEEMIVDDDADDSDIEFVAEVSKRKPAARRRAPARNNRSSARSKVYTEDSDEDIGWGTANTSVSASQRSSRRR